MSLLHVRQLIEDGFKWCHWQIKLWNYVYFTVKTALIFQQFLLNCIIYRRNRFFQSADIKDLNTFHSCEKFNVFDSCSSLFHSRNEKIFHTRLKRSPYISYNALWKNLQVCRLITDNLATHVWSNILNS